MGNNRRTLNADSALDYERYKEILRRNLPELGDEPVEGTGSLTDLGLDSLGTVRLLADLETEFDLELPDEALDESTFRTVDSLWEAFRGSAAQAAD